MLLVGNPIHSFRNSNGLKIQTLLFGSYDFAIGKLALARAADNSFHFMSSVFYFYFVSFFTSFLLPNVTSKNCP